MAVPCGICSIGQPLIAFQDAHSEVLIRFRVTAAGKRRRIGTASHRHRAGGQDTDGSRHHIAGTSTLQGLSRRIRGQLSRLQHCRLCGLKTGLPRRHAYGTCRDGDISRRCHLHRKAQCPHSLCRRSAGHTSHSAMIVQIDTAGCLGETLVQYPVRLDTQSLELGRGSPQPHCQIAALLRCKSGPFGKCRQ